MRNTSPSIFLLSMTNHTTFQIFISVMLLELYHGNNVDFHRVVACVFGTGFSYVVSGST